MSQISQIKKIYHAAIYVRLSKEDGAVASHEKTESNSIANQKSLIRDFLENKNDIEVVQEYVDDGFGVNRIFAVEYVVRDFINTEINPHTDATTVMCHVLEVKNLRRHF